MSAATGRRARDVDVHCAWMSKVVLNGGKDTQTELANCMARETQSIVQNAEIPPVPRPSASERTRLINTLDCWNFQPQKLPDEEVLACTIILFEALWRLEDMQESMQSHGIVFDSLPPLLAHLQALYRYHSHHSHSHLPHCEDTTQNPYHNFAHALDVLQSSYMFLKDAGVVPPVSVLLSPKNTWSRPPNNGPIGCLKPIDLFVIYIVAVGHDVGHPGFANGFMKNAASPLGILFSDTSPLESLHTTLLLETLKTHGLTSFLNASHTVGSGHQTHSYVAKLITKMIMCTDMCVHDSWVESWEKEFHPSPAPSTSFPAASTSFPSSSPSADPDDANPSWTQKVLICQAIIKCADISNPTRPYEVTLAWSSALLHEWISQAHLEGLLGISVTALSCATPLAEATSQVGFMTRFALPLFELVGKSVIPCLRTYQKRCKENLEIWQARKARFASECKPERDREERQTELNRLKPRPPNEYRGIFGLCLPKGFCAILLPLPSPPLTRPSPRPLRGQSSRTSSDSQSDTISISTVSSTVLSTPTSPLSPSLSLSAGEGEGEPDSSFEFTPPSSPTTTTCSFVSDTGCKATSTGTVGRKKGRGGVVQLPQPPQLHLQPPAQMRKPSKERMGLRIGTNSSPNNVNGNGAVHSAPNGNGSAPNNTNGGPKYKYCSWRGANGGGSGSSDQTSSPSSSTTSASTPSTTTHLFSPFSPPPSTSSLSPSTPAVSAISPVTPESSAGSPKPNGTGKPTGMTMNYRRALTKTPSTSCLAKVNSACRSLSSPRSVNSLRAASSSSFSSSFSSFSSSSSSPSKQIHPHPPQMGGGSSPMGEVKKSAAEKTTTPTTIVVSPPSRRGVLGGYRTAGGRS